MLIKTLNFSKRSLSGGNKWKTFGLLLLNCKKVVGVSNLSGIKGFINFLLDILGSRRLIMDLAVKDFKVRYMGSYLGILWAFIQPTFNILIMWFIFQVGFRSAPVENFPFILWLMTGLIPWYFLSDSIASGAASVLEQSYLVKKVVFRVSILPIIKIVSALVIHIFFIVFTFAMYMFYGHFPDLMSLQIFYYMFCSIVFVLGLSWITSSLMIFLRDLGQIVSIILQFIFWLTPIFWSFKLIPPSMAMYFKFNPFFYIIEGYRESLIFKVGFWTHPLLTGIFWLQTLIILVIGAVLFRKLRPHFADVL
jgi:lipopolysaccharide transport system permease protein/teichoic acid transport system permease protein